MAAHRLAAAASSPLSKRREVSLDDGVDDIEISGRSLGRRNAARRRSRSVSVSSRGGAYRSPQDARFGNRWGTDHGGAGVMCSAAGLAGEERGGGMGEDARGEDGDNRVW
jgi:hypothetical protein